MKSGMLVGGCSKLLMRWTVLSSDILVFFPAAIAFVASYYRRRRFEEQAWALGMILLQPALMLIDHGHFQVCLWPLLFVFCAN
jgi:alpha-1,3-glucosyltransferase